jgi:hypothetical protein
MSRRSRGLQCNFHLVECLICLFEEAKDYGLGEVGFPVLVHVKNLLEGCLIDMVAEINVCLDRQGQLRSMTIDGALDS